jgi:5-methylcytosine-specific restriction protein A
MPTVPLVTKCGHLGCRNERTKYSSSCIEHGGKAQPQEYNSKKKETHTKYTTKQWAIKRRIQLSSHPLCASCLSEGHIKQATTVDHVFPWTQIGEEAFYHNIFQSLCHSCHSSKTALEQKGTFRRYGTPHRDYQSHDYARIIKSI